VNGADKPGSTIKNNGMEIFDITGLGGGNNGHGKYQAQEIEVFDIEKFNREKNRFGNRHIREGEDVEIFQIWSNAEKGYKQFTTVYKQYYCEVKAYYPSGRLKYKGKMYEPGDFNIGIWEHYDEAGRLTRTEDWDKKYRVGYREALEIARYHYGYRQQDLRIDLTNSGSAWILRNTKGVKGGMALAVTTDTGRHAEFRITESEDDHE